MVTNTPKASYTPRPTPTHLDVTATQIAVPTISPTPPILGLPAGSPIELVSVIGSPVPPVLFDLMVAEDETIWLMTDRTIARLQGDTWSVYLFDFPGELIGIETTGRAWFASPDGSQIFAWDGAGWSEYGPDQGWLPVGPDSTVRHGVLTDFLGHIWVATSLDVRRFNDVRWHIFRPQNMTMQAIEEDNVFASFTLAYHSVQRRYG
jgi:hypothetical protein